MKYFLYKMQKDKYALLSRNKICRIYALFRLNKDFIKAVRGGGVAVLWKYFIKFRYFLKDDFQETSRKLL